AVPREQRHRRVDDRLAALFGVEPRAGHARRSKRLLTSGQDGVRQQKKGSKKMGGLPPRPPIACVAWGCPIPPKGPGSGHTPITVPASPAGATRDSAAHRPIPEKRRLPPLSGELFPGLPTGSIHRDRLPKP